MGGPPGGSPASFPVHIGYLLRAEDALWSSRFVDGARVDLRGNLTMHLMFKDLGNGAAGLRIESLEFDARGFEDYVTRSTLANIERALVAAAADAATAHPALKNTAPDDGVKDDSQSEDGQGGSSRRRTSRTQPGRGMSTRRRSAASKTEQDNDDDRATLHIDDDGAAPPCPPPPHSKDVKGHPLALKDHHGDLINLLRERVAPSPVGAFGVTEMGMRCLEVRLRSLSSAFGHDADGIRLLADCRICRSAAELDRLLRRLGRRAHRCASHSRSCRDLAADLYRTSARQSRSPATPTCIARAPLLRLLPVRHT